ncbi:hypothetical protein NC651_039533 [Populus alba x Populus x berolinensis]|nr:hypothetical protein NC651_039533 [Populus alba x Populus x berolinensis]
MQPYTSSEELTKLNKHVQNPTFSTSIQHSQDFLREKPSRKLLQEALVSQPPMLASPSPSGGATYPSSELYTGHRLVPDIVSVSQLCSKDQANIYENIICWAYSVEVKVREEGTNAIQSMHVPGKSKLVSFFVPELK